MKTINLVTVFAIVILAISCKKETNTTRDTIKPKAQITITGSGFSKTFYSDSTYNGQLNLNKNTTYTVTVTGVDTGGIRLLELSMSNDITYGSFIGVPNHTTAIEGINKLFRITTSISDPYVSFLLSGSFTTYNTDPSIDESTAIEVGARDWGNNLGYINIPCLITAQPPTGQYGWMSF